MKFTSFFYILISVLFLSACKSSSGGGGKPADPQTPLVANACMGIPGGFVNAVLANDDKKLFNCLRFNGPPSTITGLPRRLDISTVGFTIAEKLQLAKWADEHNEELKNFKIWPTAHTQSFGEFLVVTKAPTRDLWENVLEPVTMSGVRDRTILGAPSPKFFPTVDELIAYLSAPDQKQDASSLSKIKDGRIEALLNFYHQNFRTQLTMKESFYQGTCDVSCIQSSPVVTYKDFKLVYEEYLMEGIAYRAVLILKNKNDDVVGFINLAGQRISSLFVIDRDTTGIARKVKGYDVFGEVVYDFPISMSVSFDELSKRPSLVSNTGKFDFTVMICENEFSPESFKKLNMSDRLVFGPHLNASYYGWNAIQKNARSFWQGRLYFNGFDLTNSSQPYQEHAEDVSEAFIENDPNKKAGIIPIGFDACSRREAFENSWPAIAADGRTRVASVSIVNYMDQQTCLLTADDYPMAHTPEVLWVMAAGNESSATPVACPVFFFEEPNVITVGANEGSLMHPMSNFSASWVDVATTGNAVQLPGWGTSFAAPRVALLAGKIFNQFPHLQPLDVKQILILSATDIGLPVRSGGPLDEHLVWGYTSLIGQGATVKQAIEKMECGTSGAPVLCPPALKKIQKLNLN